MTTQPASPMLTVDAITAPVTAAQVEDVRFTPVRLRREGYDMSQVDMFLDEVIATLNGTARNPLTATDVRDRLFTPVRLREGYHMGQVDHFLDAIEETLERSFRLALVPDQPEGEGPTFKCGICFATVAAEDEDGHRSWHVQLTALAGRRV